MKFVLKTEVIDREINNKPLIGGGLENVPHGGFPPIYYCDSSTKKNKREYFSGDVIFNISDMRKKSKNNRNSFQLKPV